MFPRSCDTFAALPPGTYDGSVIFGKNSDRPSDEVQEVIYVPAVDYRMPWKLKCTYIEIDQVGHTYGVILSKPSWMWGAEMGANDHNVCIGNEAVWTKLNGRNDTIEKLLGMDLLRLGLERGATAYEALQVIVSLLKKYGMGGNCSDTLTDFTYHNSFLIADPSEVWVLECAGDVWAAEKVTSGARNISNELSIGTKIDLMSENLEEFAKEKRFWDSSRGPFNFKLAFKLDFDDFESHRFICGKRLLAYHSKKEQFKPTSMFSILRDRTSGICMSSGSFLTTGSQVSVLRKPGSREPSCHWFTATPDPCRSVFKPFFFTDHVDFPQQVISPVSHEGQAAEQLDRKHELYKLHEQILNNPSQGIQPLPMRMQDMETDYVCYAEEITTNFISMKEEASLLFKTAIETEMNLYSANR